MTVRIPSPTFVDRKEWELSITNAITSLINGKTNNTKSLTLVANSASTQVAEAPGRIGLNTIILFMPTTANAATEYASGGMYVSAIDIENRTFTITHANNAQTDRTFNYVLIG